MSEHDLLQKYRRRPPHEKNIAAGVFRDDINTGDGSTQFWLASQAELPEFAMRAALVHPPRRVLKIVLWEGERASTVISVEIPQVGRDET